MNKRQSKKLFKKLDTCFGKVGFAATVVSTALKIMGERLESIGFPTSYNAADRKISSTVKARVVFDND